MHRQRSQVSNANGVVTKRPGVCEGVDFDRHRSLKPTGSGFRQHGKADSAFGQSTNGIKPAQPDTYIEPPAEPRRIMIQKLLERAAERRTYEVVIEDLSKCDLSLLTKGMLPWPDNNEADLSDRIGLQFVGRIDCFCDDADVRNALGDQPHNLSAGTILELEIDIGVSREECDHRVGKQLSYRHRIPE